MAAKGFHMAGPLAARSADDTVSPSSGCTLRLNLATGGNRRSRSLAGCGTLPICERAGLVAAVPEIAGSPAAEVARQPRQVRRAETAANIEDVARSTGVVKVVVVRAGGVQRRER